MTVVADSIESVVDKYFEIVKLPHDEFAKDFLRRAQSFSVKVNNKIFKYYRRGSGPTVVLVHGLHSNLASMIAIAEDLVDRGYKVVLFDAPAHGEASGASTDPFEVREFMRKIAGQLGEIHAVVCHSLGGLWALSAWDRGLRAHTFVSIASPSSKKFLVEKFVQLNQLDEETAARLMRELEARFGQDVWTEFSPAERVKSVDVPGLIIHGKDDDFVPPDHAQHLHANWAGSRVEMLDSTGHFDIVASPKVRRLIAEHLQALAERPISTA